MKTLFKSKYIFLLIVIGILFSCKKQDGYSDEIETGKVVDDTSQIVTDTINVNNNKGVNSTGNNSPTVISGKSSNASSAGTGSGPGENANDASTYTSSSGVQQDSVSSKAKGSQNKSK